MRNVPVKATAPCTIAHLSNFDVPWEFGESGWMLAALAIVSRLALCFLGSLRFQKPPAPDRGLIFRSRGESNTGAPSDSRAMQPTPERIDELYRERVLRARRMPLEEKLLAGPRLFEYACEITRAGIRQQFPEADEQRVQEILAERLSLRRKLERRREH